MDRRMVSRNRVLKAGTIEFGGGAVNCVVRNISIAGAALDVSNPTGIPEDFIRVDGVRKFCHVNWRSGKRIGVSFD
jgi:hypothetical protein